MPSHEGASPRRPVDGDVAAPRRQRRQRATPDERIAPPPFPALDGLEEKALSVTDDVGEARDRSERVGDDLAPHGDDRMLLGQCGKLGRVGPEVERAPRVHAGRGHHVEGTPGPLPRVRWKHDRSPV